MTAATTSPTTPFACSFTPQFPDLLAELGCSLVISTYQAGKVIVLSADGERLVQLPRTFDTPMGIAVEGRQLAVATQFEIVLLANDPRLAASFPSRSGAPSAYDALYLPRSTHHCGRLAVHDMVFTRRGLVGVNTLFSCLFALDPSLSFAPLWKPPFISALAPEDRCHLNGVAVENGEPRWVTALGATDTAAGWRADKDAGGVLVDVASGEIALGGLAMPHTPRVYDGRLYALLSATGELAAVDPARGRYDVVRRIDGFVRGMARAGDHLFIASSRFRKSHTFGDLQRARDERAFCGITALHLPTASLVAELRYLRSCEEIYDVQVLPGLRRPGILGLHDGTHRRAIASPEQAFWTAGEADDDA